MKFELKQHPKENAAVLTIREHKLDATVSSQLKAEFLVLCNDALKKLVVDMSAVEYCDSSGLSSLLIADRKMREHGGSVVLVGMQKQVESLLKISMLDRVFAESDSVAKALKG